MLVHDAPVYLLEKFLWVSHALAQIVHYVLVTLRIGIGHIITQTDVAAMHDAVQFRQFPDNLRIEVEDTTIVLTQLLNALWRHKTTTDKLFLGTFCYPLGFLHIALATWKLFDELGIDKL